MAATCNSDNVCLFPDTTASTAYNVGFCIGQPQQPGPNLYNCSVGIGFPSQTTSITQFATVCDDTLALQSYSSYEWCIKDGDNGAGGYISSTPISSEDVAYGNGGYHVAYLENTTPSPSPNNGGNGNGGNSNAAMAGRPQRVKAAIATVALLFIAAFL